MADNSIPPEDVLAGPHMVAEPDDELPTVRLTKKKIKSILDLYESLKSDRADQESKYDEWENAYLDDGSLSDTQRYPDYDSEATNHYDVIVNLIQSTVEQKRAMIGVIPNLHCPPNDYKPESVALAQKRERAIYSIWEDSKIGQVMGDMAYYLSIFGTAVGVVYADEKRKRPKMTVRSPRGFYCVPSDEDGIQLAVAIFYAELDGNVAEGLYPGYKFEDMETVEILEYWDRKIHAIFTKDGKTVLLAHENKLGVVPVVTIPNIGRPKDPFGKSDVQLYLSLQKELNRRFAYEAEIAEKVKEAPYVLINPEGAPEEIAIEPGAVIPVGQGGDLKQINSFNLPYNWEMSFNRFLSMFDRQADAPEVMRGTMDNSVVTGRGVDALKGPVAGRISLRHNYVFPRLEWMNSIALMMWEKFWPNEEHSLYGSISDLIKDTMFIMKFRPSELKGDYRNKVFLNSYAYLDQNAQVVLGLQMVQNQIISKMTLRQQLDFIEDPSSEEEQIKKEALLNAELAAQAQQYLMSPATMNPPLNEPDKTNYNIQQGRAGELEAAPVPGGLDEAMGGGMGTPPPQGGPEGVEGAMAEEGFESEPEFGSEQEGENQMLQMFADFMRSIQKIKGRVFLAGAILRGPEDLDEAGVVDIFITDGKDKQTISNAVRNQVPELHGSLEFHSGQPEGQYLEVTPGTEGYEIEGRSNVEEEEENPEGISGGGINPFGGAGGAGPLPTGGPPEGGPPGMPF